jgi:hypothetical protein
VRWNGGVHPAGAIVRHAAYCFGSAQYGGNMSGNCKFAQQISRGEFLCIIIK